MPSEFDTLFADSALPVLHAVFAEDAGGDTGSPIALGDGPAMEAARLFARDIDNPLLLGSMGLEPVGAAAPRLV